MELPSADLSVGGNLGHFWKLRTVKIISLYFLRWMCLSGCLMRAYGRQNALLEFARVVKSREQVVAGKLYYLTIEAIDVGKKKVYEAKVWVKPWMNFKKLEDFKYAHDATCFTTSDLGLKRGTITVPLP